MVRLSIYGNTDDQMYILNVFSSYLSIVFMIENAKFACVTKVEDQINVDSTECVKSKLIEEVLLLLHFTQ